MLPCVSTTSTPRHEETTRLSTQIEGQQARNRGPPPAAIRPPPAIATHLPLLPSSPPTITSIVPQPQPLPQTKTPTPNLESPQACLNKPTIPNLPLSHLCPHPSSRRPPPTTPHPTPSIAQGFSPPFLPRTLLLFRPPTRSPTSRDAAPLCYDYHAGPRYPRHRLHRFGSRRRRS